MNRLPPLFKKTKTGAIQQCKIWSETDFHSFGAVLTQHGQIGGKQQVDTFQVGRKNVGKKNETSFEDQAIAEALSKWNKKLDEGYVADVEMVDDLFILPMLAHKFGTGKSINAVWKDGPAFIQTKLDGVRCLAFKQDDVIKLISRKGKEFTAIDHIKDALMGLMENGDIFDGELYNHSKDFQWIVSRVKKERPDSKEIQYHVYDFLDVNNPDMPYWRRSEVLDLRFFNCIPSERDTIQQVPTGVVTDVVDLDKQTAVIVAKGYEGSIIRARNGVYAVNQRSKDLLKFKYFFDAEYEIVGSYEGKGRDAGTAVFTCKLENGTEFGCRPIGSLEIRKAYWTNRESYIGKLLTVKYQRLSNDGVPVGGISGIGIRESWDVS